MGNPSFVWLPIIQCFPWKSKKKVPGERQAGVGGSAAAVLRPQPARLLLGVLLVPLGDPVLTGFLLSFAALVLFVLVATMAFPFLTLMLFPGTRERERESKESGQLGCWDQDYGKALDGLVALHQRLILPAYWISVGHIGEYHTLQNRAIKHHLNN